VLLSHRSLEKQREFFHISVVKSNLYDSIDFFNYFSVLIREVDVSIDETFLNSLLNFVSSLNLADVMKSPPATSSFEADEYLPIYRCN
jgi:hypothetical protein